MKAVRVFLIPFRHRSFTHDLLKTALSKIAGNDYSGILYLAPTPHKIREAQIAFHSMAKGAYIPPVMMTLKQFSKRLYSVYGSRSVIPPTLMPVIISRLSGKGMGFSSIISSFINELKQYRPGKDVEAIRNELKDVFNELGIPEEGLMRAMDAIEVFKNYHDALNEHNATDDNDILKECPGLIEQHDYKPIALILDGFYEITPIEELLLKELIKRADLTLISIPYSEDYASITGSYISFIRNNFNIETSYLLAEEKPLCPPYFAYPGIDEEVEGIARHIKNLFISGKCRSLDKIILTFPKLHIYSDIIQRIFGRFGIPFNFYASSPAGKTRPFLDLLALLESIEADYPRLPFSRFLVSPYFKKLPDIFKELVPGISLNSGILRGKNSWINLANNDSDLPPEFGKKLNWIFKKFSLLESMKEECTYARAGEALNKLLIELDFSDADIDIRAQLSNVLKELFFADNFIPKSGKSYIQGSGLRRFIEHLKYLLNTVDTETEGSGVKVIEMFDLRGSQPEYLYIGGLRDGDLPSMPEIDHMLPDSVRTRLGLVNMKSYLNLQKFIFQQLTDSSKSPHLSYPVMEADKLFLPSPFLPWRTGAEEKVPGILCKEEELLRSGTDPLSVYIKEISDVRSNSIKQRFGINSYIRVTEIDYYRTCPRKFFIEKVLDIEPPEIKEYEIEALFLGTIIHRVMEGLISEKLKNIDEMRTDAQKLLDELLDNYLIEDYWKNLIKDSFLSILPDIFDIERDISKEGYSFMKAEAPVEGEVLSGVKLRGTIDRVDKKVVATRNRDDSVELIDYKTGAAQLNRSDVLNKGATLQLFLYAVLMKSLGLKVERAGIYSLKDINITWVPGKNDKREGRTIDDYIEASLKYLEKTILKLRGGDFSALPLNEQTCRTCHERPYCPFIQKPL